MTRLLSAGLLALALFAVPAHGAAAGGCGFTIGASSCLGYGYLSVSCAGCCGPGGGCYGYGPCFTPAYASWGLPAPTDQGGYPGYPGSPYNYPGAAYGFPPPAPGFAYGSATPSYWYGH